MDSPSAPAAPDPRAVADAQGTVNADAARLTTSLNRYDQVTPYGTLKWSTAGPIPTSSMGGGTAPDSTAPASPTRTFDQAGYDAAMAAYSRQQSSGTGGWRPAEGSTTTQAEIDDWLARNPNATDAEKQQVAANYGVQYASPTPTVGVAPPDRESFYRTAVGADGGVTGGAGGGNASVTTGDRWTSTMTLDPRVQAVVDAQLEQSKGMADTANTALQRTQTTLAEPINYAGLPNRADPQALHDYISGRFSGGVEGDIGHQRDLAFQQGNTALQASRRMEGAWAQPQNYGGVQAMPTPDDEMRQRIEDALYQRQTSRLDPQFQQMEEGNRSILMNRGITENSDAWRREMDNLNRARNDAYSGARWDSITKGGEEMQRQFQMGLAGRQQGVNEANYLRESVGREALATQGMASQSGADLSRMYATEMAQQQAINNGTTQAYDLMSNARSNALSEEERKRAQVLNELSALRTGAQVQSPQFQPSAGGAGAMTPANYAQMVQNGYQGELGMYNAQVGANNATTGAAGALGAAALMAMI